LIAQRWLEPGMLVQIDNFQDEGQLKVRVETPPLYAIPTTAGSGSEATLAAVVSETLAP
jgi:alcohol dehydrogenase class IV